MLRQSETWVILPTIGRPLRLRTVLGSLKATAPEVNCNVVVEPEDVACLDIATEMGYWVTRLDKEKAGCSYAWNFGLRYTPPFAKAFVLGADDLIFKPNWFEEAVKVLEEELHGSGLVGFNDLLKVQYWSTHYLMTRDFVAQYNGGVMACPEYKTDYVDVETCERAIRAGKYAVAPRAIVQHDWIGRNPDKFFIESRRDRSSSKARFENRRAEGFPDNFPAVIR